MKQLYSAERITKKKTETNQVELRKISRSDRLQMMEEIWDSLLSEEEEIVSPGWHRDVLEARRRKIKRGEAEFVSIEELKRS